MRNIKKLLALLLTCSLSLGTFGCVEKSDAEKSDGDTAVSSEENDRSAKKKEKPRLQDDFYDYVNYDSLKDMEIPYGEEAMSLFSLNESVDQTKEMIKEIGASTEKFAAGSNEQIIHDAYRQFLEYKDDGYAEKIIMDNCDRIRAAENIQELFEVWGDLARNYGADSIIQLSVRRDYKDGSRYSLYNSPVNNFFDSSIKKLREESQEASKANDIARDMLRALGDDYETANEKGRQMAYLGIYIADATDVDLKMDLDLAISLERISFSEFDSILSNLDGSAVEMFFGDAEKYTDGIYVADKGQLEKINELITDDNLERWRTYLLSSYLYSFCEYIRSSNEIFAEYAPESKKEQDEQAAGFVMDLCADQLSELYAEKYYTPELDEAIHGLFDDIISSYDELITKADWLSEEARTLLKKKLHNIILITTPVMHETAPDDAKLIGRNKFETVINFKKEFIRKSLEKLPKKVDRNVPDMLSMDYNAQYLPCNSINITVAIMQKPMFDVNGDRAENLGGLGFVVGHEIGHAFDSTLMQYNADGNYDPEWLPETDRKALKERADALTEYYSKYTIMEVYHVDGELTNGENYADIGSMECITNLLDDKADLERMFKRYAESWCSLAVDKSGIDQVLTDEHSPEKIRVNAVLSSNSKFNEVFGLKEGDGMYAAPEERVSRW